MAEPADDCKAPHCLAMAIVVVCLAFRWARRPVQCSFVLPSAAQDVAEERLLAACFC